MARSSMFTREEIVGAALGITRESGIDAVTARSVGSRLGTSYRPICGFFGSMDELRTAVIETAYSLYRSYIDTDMQSGKYPPYKASGMAYIRFAREERELFKLLFMRDRTNEDKTVQASEVEMLASLICKQVNISHEQAMLFYLEMWTCVHGIATMVATSYYDWSEELCSQTLTDMYMGLKHKYEACGGEEK